MSAYKTRINKALAGLSIKADLRKMLRYKRGYYDEAGLTGAEEFRLDRAEYSVRGECCDLCGHNPIKRVFIIENRTTGKEARIGSECAKNYARADLVAGMAKLLDTEYLKRTNVIKFEKELETLERIKADPTLVTEARASFRSVLSKMTYCGSIRPVIDKIKGGKRITKKEKEIINFWTVVEENRAGLAPVAAFNKFVAAYAKSKWEREWEALRKERAAKEASKAFGNALVVATAIVIDSLEKFFNAVAASAEGKKPFSEPTIDELLAAVPKKNSFVKSLERQYNTKGNLSSGQLRALKGTVATGKKASLVLDALFAGKPEGEDSFFDSVRNFYNEKGFLTFKQARAVSRFF